MTESYLTRVAPYIIHSADGGLVEEYFGSNTPEDKSISIAHIVVPPGWNEPSQCPEFDEYTIMVRGAKMVELEDEKIIVGAGESILVYKGTKVHYSNPFDQEAEYWAICKPAFSPETAHRDDAA